MQESYALGGTRLTFEDSLGFDPPPRIRERDRDRDRNERGSDDVDAALRMQNLKRRTSFDRD